MLTLMKRSVFGSTLIMMLIGVAYTAQAQQAENNTPTLRELLRDRKNVKLNTALFSNVEVIDNRFDTSVAGVFNEVYGYSLMYASSQDLKEEVIAVANYMISNASKQPGTLLINIRKFYLSENSGQVKGYATDAGKGKFVFQASCYLKQETFYRLMFTVDTTVKVKTYDGTTRKLMDTVQGTLSAFIQQAALFDTAACAPNRVTSYDIQHIDDAEKRTIPVYNIEQPERGIYTSYEDFKNNHPTQGKFIAEYRKGFKRPFIYDLTDDSKKGKEILRKDYYIICDEGKMFVSAVFGLYPLEKRNNDFYFTIGKGDHAEISRSNAPSIMFDALGSMAPEANTLKNLEFKIDHTTGRFLPIFKQPL